MSSIRKRQALYGYAPGAERKQKLYLALILSPQSTIPVPEGATYNNGGNMKFGLYPTVGKSVGFLNLLSNCCRNGTNKTGFVELLFQTTDVQHA